VSVPVTPRPALAEAARALFVGPDGGRLPVGTRRVTGRDAAALAAGSPGPGLVVCGAEALAEAAPEGATAAVAVVLAAEVVDLMWCAEPLGAEAAALLGGLGAATAGLAGSLSALRSEASVLDALHAVGRSLTAQLDLDRVVQDATDAATAATGAAFGAFFYNLINEYGESYMLYTLSGVPRESFSRFPMPRNTAVFAPTFDGTGTVRSDDIQADPRFGRNAPYHGMPEGHLPVHSYLAVSVVSPSTEEVLGGFFFGHPDTGVFSTRHEYLAEVIASYAAIALDNARLYERERNLASELSRSMLPEVPALPGLQVVARYLPAATGTKIGGDWFDVIPMPSGGTAFVIGDVVGHGVTAATIMGQIRTAIRSYAMLELPPSELLRRVSVLCSAMFGVRFATCFYAVHDPVTGTLSYANAGHLPAVLIGEDGVTRQVGEALAQPLGVGSVFPQREVALPAGTDLLLYTDGLVESRTRDLTLGMEWLVSGLAAVRAASVPAAAIDALIEGLTGGRHDDDIALLHVRTVDGGPR
jgi:hypothetical protein